MEGLLSVFTKRERVYGIFGEPLHIKTPKNSPLAKGYFSPRVFFAKGILAKGTLVPSSQMLPTYE